MDLDRPHFRTTSTGTTTTSTSDLFICFTSRLSSSSSMKLSKSILSPGRAARDGGATTLSSSLSRRLRTNGSLKGGQASPFFTTTGKKRGCGFENPEPSSPKVTCIGQVRVKTKKKKAKQSRSLSRRRSGEVMSFRKIEQQQQQQAQECVHYQPAQQECVPNRNQKWIHLPVSICEALRAFGAEFSCLFPCKSSSCFSSNEEREKREEEQNGSDGNGCGTVFRWLVSVNDGEGGKRREIELVVGGGDEVDEEERVSMRSSRRHVFEDIEVKDDNRIEVKRESALEGNGGEEEEAGRVSICIPPKNALLLMRCRSDPMKMAALTNRFSWDAHAVAKDDDVEEEIDVEGNGVVEEKEVGVGQCDGKDEIFVQDCAVDVAAVRVSNEEEEIRGEAEASLEMETEDGGNGEESQEEGLAIGSEEMEIGEEREREELQRESLGNEEGTLMVEEQEEEEEEEEVESIMDSFEALLDKENAEPFEDCPTQDKDELDDNPIRHLSPSTESDDEYIQSVPSLFEEDEIDRVNEATEESNITEKDPILAQNDDEANQSTFELIKPEPETTANQEEGETVRDKIIRVTEDAETDHVEDGDEEEQETVTEPETENQELVISNGEESKREKEGKKLLPDCLLLMMCEPKLSMEVSKETWVCSTDFIRWLPRKPANKPPKADQEPPVKRHLSIDSKPKPDDTQRPQQPPRSSCSLSMANLIEQKLVNAAAYEPFVLTRCKSEPMRTAVAKLMPESCFWKNAVRKLEPHRRATFGVGAAGVGF